MALPGTPSDLGKHTRNLDNFIKNLVSFDPGATPMEPAPSHVDLIVYRVGSQASADGARQSQQSVGSRQSKASQGSRASRMNSVLSNRGLAAFIERSTFTVREWILLFIEMFISFAWFVIRHRRRSNTDLLKRGWTDRMELMDVYLDRALSGLCAMFAGYVADTYIGIYPVALMNIALHFIVSSVLLMEEIIKYNDFNIYHGIVWETVGWSFIPLKATDFARMVFGLEQMGRKNIKAVTIFVFLSVWLNERSCGGILILVIGIFQLSHRASVQISFFVTGIASILYIYNFRPDPNKITGISGIGNKIVGCIVTALWTKWRLRGRVHSKHWLELALVKFERLYVTKTKQLLRLYLMIIPTVGLLFFVTSRSDFYFSLWYRMKPYGLFYYTGVLNGARIITLSVMAVLALGVIPVVLNVFSIKRNFLRRFVIGYLSALICYYYSANLLRKTQGIQPSLSLGLVRFINTGNIPVHITSREKGVLNFNNTVKAHSGIMASIDVKEYTLFKVMFRFGNRTNFTSMITVTPNEVKGYVALYPPAILRIAGNLPIWESPPGYNVPYMARLYISNLIRKTNTTVLFQGLRSNPNNGSLEPTGTLYNVIVREGNSSNLQVPAGMYRISVSETDLSGNSTITVGKGGVYIIILFSTPSANQISTDTIIEENQMSAVLTVGISVPYAMALVFSYVSLRAFLFTNTPEGLEGLCFGFLEALENTTSWVLWIGYLTWHPFVTAFTLTVYSVMLTLLFFFCLFILIKYDEYYRW